MPIIRTGSPAAIDRVYGTHAAGTAGPAAGLIEK
jgi:hypothetical protein